MYASEGEAYKMVMHMLAYARKSELDRDVRCRQHIRGTNAADLQKVWTSVSTTGQDDFLAGGDTLHSGSGAGRELHAGSEDVTTD